MEKRELLEKLSEIVKYDYDNGNKNWDGIVSPEGMKRYLYGLWHNGHNERGHNMIIHFDTIGASQMYVELMNKVKSMNLPEPKIIFPPFERD